MRRRSRRPTACTPEPHISPRDACRRHARRSGGSASDSPTVEAMGGQVLGGGVIMLVAVLLWLVYLLPSWHSRRQYDAAERNAVRLNQALRVLAETSETPHEVRLELNTRTAHAQQRIARRALAERQDLARRTQTEHEQAGLEVARRELASARALPAARQARARRRARTVITVIAALSLGLFAAGIWVRRRHRHPAADVGGRDAGRDEPRAACAACPSSAPAAAARRSGQRMPRRTPTPRFRMCRSRRTPARGRRAGCRSRSPRRPDRGPPRSSTRPRRRSRCARPRSPRRCVSAPKSCARRRSRRRVATARGGLSDDAEIEAHVRELLARRAVGQ